MMMMMMIMMMMINKYDEGCQERMVISVRKGGSFEREGAR